MPRLGLGHLLDPPSQQAQREKLALVEHLPVTLVAPAMESLRFITVRYLVLWQFQFCVPGEKRRSPGDTAQIRSIRRLEEAAAVRGAAPLAVVFHPDKAVPGWALRSQLRRISALVAARGARVAVSPCRALRPIKGEAAVRAGARRPCFGQLRHLN